MSYDLYLSMDTGNGDSITEDIGNYTSNISNMYEAAGLGHIEDYDDKLAKDCIEALRKAVTHMENNSSIHTALEPPNGWGDYEGALEFLTKTLRMCIKHPNAILRVWC